MLPYPKNSQDLSLVLFTLTLEPYQSKTAIITFSDEKNKIQKGGDLSKVTLLPNVRATNKTLRFFAFSSEIVLPLCLFFLFSREDAQRSRFAAGPQEGAWTRSETPIWLHVTRAWKPEADHNRRGQAATTLPPLTSPRAV